MVTWLSTARFPSSSLSVKVLALSALLARSVHSQNREEFDDEYDLTIRVYNNDKLVKCSSEDNDITVLFDTEKTFTAESARDECMMEFGSLSELVSINEDETNMLFRNITVRCLEEVSGIDAEAQNLWIGAYSDTNESEALVWKWRDETMFSYNRFIEEERRRRLIEEGQCGAMDLTETNPDWLALDCNDTSIRGFICSYDDSDLLSEMTTNQPSGAPTTKPDKDDKDEDFLTSPVFYASAGGAGIVLICCVFAGIYFWKFNARDQRSGSNLAGVPPPLPSDKNRAESLRSMSGETEMTLPAIMKETDNYDGMAELETGATDTNTDPSLRAGEPATYHSSDGPKPSIDDPSQPNAVPPWERKSQPPPRPGGSPVIRPKSPPRSPVRAPPSPRAGGVGAPPPLPPGVGLESNQMINEQAMEKNNRMDRGVSDLFASSSPVPAMVDRVRAPSEAASIGERAVSTLEQDKQEHVLGIQPQVDPSAYSSTPGGPDSSDEDEPDVISAGFVGTPGEGPSVAMDHSIGVAGLPPKPEARMGEDPTHSWEGFGEEAYAQDPEFDPYAKPMLKWTVANVRQWFDCFLDPDLRQYSDFIGEHAIDGQELRGLNREALKEIGITKFGHQNKLLRAIEQLYAYQKPGAPSAGQ